MKRFRFRLEAVLGIRDLAERRARERFGFAQKKVADATEAVVLAKHRRAEIGAALAAALTGSFRAVDRVGGMAALRVAERGELEAVRLLVEAETARDRVREEWLFARRRLQVIEKLEERARQAHRDAADKAEQNLLDELGSMAAARVAPLV
jgi:flagellar protein FliJ